MQKPIISESLSQWELEGDVRETSQKCGPQKALHAFKQTFLYEVALNMLAELTVIERINASKPKNLRNSSQLTNLQVGF